MRAYTLLSLSLYSIIFTYSLYGQDLQQLTISEGIRVNAKDILICLNNLDLEDKGEFIHDSSFVIIRSEFGTKDPFFLSSSDFFDLGIELASAKLILEGDLQVSHQLKLLEGDLDLNGHGVFLGMDDGEIAGENKDSRIIGEGFIEKYVLLNEGSDMKPGNLGLHLWSDSKLGLSRIRRIQHLHQNDSLRLVLRQYEIKPSFSSQQAIQVSMDFFASENPFEERQDLIPLNHKEGKWESLAFSPQSQRIIATLPADQDAWNIGISSKQANLEAIENNNLNYEISPNPFADKISIEWENSEDRIMEVNLFNLEGKRLYHEKLERYHAQFEIHSKLELAEGMYMLQMISESGIKISEQLLHQ